MDAFLVVGSFSDFITEVFSTFSDVTVYFVMAAVGSMLFGIRLLLMLFVGVDAGGDFDLDVDADGGLEAHGGDFSLFSLISILSFMMGAGWLGLACRLDWGCGPVKSALFAGLFGFALAFLSSFLLWQMRKLSESGAYQVNDCLGKIGRVYLKIPATGQGRGQVQITVSGRQKVLEAISKGEEIESFASVKVTAIEGEETLVVERA
jgi:hypothetical protein